MKAVILAAGRGRRMGIQTQNSPKCMTRLGGKPLIAWQISAMRSAGIKDITAISGYMGQALDGLGLNLIANDEWESTNMVYSLTRASGILHEYECLVSYSDIIYSAGTLTTLLGGEGDIRIAYDRNWYELWSARFEDPLSDAETFMIDEDGTMTGIGERTASLADIQGQYIGLLYFTPAGWRQVENYIDSIDPELAKTIDMTGLLARLIRARVKIRALPIEDPWLEVDNEKDLNLYRSWLESGERPLLTRLFQ